ncbi:hypothetical protein Bca52824_011235 [Brassica carinata]|uniref:Uncharacterized protein n=1 Tax=Brassica carinata TaxID=52824 RepID=A0A8X8BBH0_BRACI|nr:hypothetical protein Bca52824_011235 [Brassica carinata]
MRYVSKYSRECQSLQRWLSDSGPRRKWVDTGERGLLASQNLRKREKLLFVPPSLVIAADSVWTNGEAGEVMKRFDVSDLPLLATCASIDDDAAAVADEGARLAVHGRIDANATEFQELLDSLKAICSPISLRVSKEAEKVKSWLEKNEAEQKKSSLWKKPVFTSNEVYTKVFNLQDKVSKVYRISKPKPKTTKNDNTLKE